LQVSVTDDGAGRMSDVAFIYIVVEDRNDWPYFESINEDDFYEWSIDVPEDMKVGDYLTTSWVPRDEDTGSVLTAKSHSWWDRHWTVDSTVKLGEPMKIYLDQELDFEQESWSWFGIEVRDNGVAGDRQSKYGWFGMSVRILDVNEPPIPTNLHFTVSEDATIGSLIGRPLEAKDPDKDQSETLSFNIDRENCFSRNTGPVKRYVAFPPVFREISEHRVTLKVIAQHSVHILMYNTGKNSVEIVYGAKHNTISKIQKCKKVQLIGSEIKTSACEELVSKSSVSILSTNDFTDIWVHYDASTGTVSTGTGTINTENTFMKVEGFAAQTFSKYAVSTGY
jgi:hypothetical protein